MIILNETDHDKTILVATENGFGKRTLISEFPTKNRGGQGVIAIKVEGRNGQVIGAETVLPEDDIIFITGTGKLVRTGTDEIPTVGRNTQGVRLMRLDEGEKLASLGKIIESEDETD